MLPDPVIRRVAGKELTLFFASPVAWLFLGSFAAISLFVFFWGEAFFARNVADVRPLFEWMPILLIFLCSALTMRMWSEERRTGTLEYLLSLPVPLWRFVVGKFCACLALLCLALLITLLLPFTVSSLGNLDWGPVLAGYLATVLLGAAYLAIGLFVSARSDNPIVSLIGSVAIGGLFYLLGSAMLTSLVGNLGGELLRSLSTGARFDAITRGVIDLRDLVYYLSVVLIFLTLNIYSLERERWSKRGRERHHRQWRLTTALVVANALLLNLWLSPLHAIRLDVTGGRLYSISPATHQYLSQLQEPLLLRGYFSAKTHPLLAPLVPQLRDLLREYEVAGDGRLRVEIIDPVEHPEMEQEANQRYGIRAVPFQVADRYQAALVNSYFNVLVEYGDSFQVLGFEDLIEVKASATSSMDVQLRNPEFNLTRAIKQALYSYRAGGNLFDSIEGEVEFTGYVSAAALLPEALQSYRRDIAETLRTTQEKYAGRFHFRFVEPEADGAAVARQIEEEWGFKPMVASLFATEQFYFYLTLTNERQVVQLPIEDFNSENFQQVLDAGLKRFASGFTKTVALVTPQPDPQLARFGAAGPQFHSLEQTITQDHSIRMEDLGDGSVTAQADLLIVAAPENLDEKQLFAIDQFLMRGATVVLATAPFMSQSTSGSLTLQPHSSGLEEWLQSHGIELQQSLVLDPQNTAFPIPITRQVGGFSFQEVAMVDYPYFVDVRGAGINSSHPVTGNLPQVTMSWAAPLTIDGERNAEREIIELLRSSEQSWTSESTDILPRAGADGISGWQPPAATGSNLLGVIVSGRFDSWFTGKTSPLLEPPPTEESVESDTREESTELNVGSVIERSPESARLVVLASNDFLTDQILRTISSMSGGQYLGPLELVANAIDWSLEDSGLLGIRSHAHFNRTLAPLDKDQQLFWEYLNYGLALGGLLLVALWQRRRRGARNSRYLQELGEAT